ncbi:MAG: hypothetical protein HKN76_08350 [Saprospiraceae bacterium]|nr:hypothetical protein [Saprospiraceae bacterium]
MTNILIQIGQFEFPAVVDDTPTGQAILDIIPFNSSANTWGDEIYFHIPAQAELESQAKATVAVGDLAYWPTMPAFCIFFGPTPASVTEQPQAASSVNVFGRLKEVDLNRLRQIQGGEEVTVKKARRLS